MQLTHEKQLETQQSEIPLVKSILIIGDLARCAVIGEALGKLQERVVVASSTFVVLQHTSETAAPVVILDSSIDDTWGAVEQIRSGFPKAAIYFLMDRAMMDDEKKRALQLNLKCLAKPFNATRFRNDIKEHLSAD